MLSLTTPTLHGHPETIYSQVTKDSHKCMRRVLISLQSTKNILIIHSNSNFCLSKIQT